MRLKKSLSHTVWWEMTYNDLGQLCIVYFGAWAQINIHVKKKKKKKNPFSRTLFGYDFWIDEHKCVNFGIVI